MTRLQKIIIGLSALLLAGLLGCAAFQDGIVPAFIDPNVMEYVGVDVNDVLVFTPYTSLWDAKRLKNRVDFTHQLNQTVYSRMIEDDNMEYGFLSDVMATHIASAEELKTNLFSPEGAIGLLMPAMAGLGIGWLGLSKPADKKQIEVLKNGGK